MSELDFRSKYEAWLQDPVIDDDTKQELRKIAGQPQEIEDRFYKDLEFGTGGMRGVIGAGTNRVNRYTIGKASQGLAQYILRKFSGKNPSAVIAYDSRHCSDVFALETALVLAGNGIKAYLFESLRPTPELSFAVRELKASAGVVITASHNPPEYNGFKVYNQTGGQLVPDEADQVIAEVAAIQSFGDIRKADENEAVRAGLLVRIGDDIDRRYADAVTAVSPNAAKLSSWAKDYKVVFTPLHGTGNKPVRMVLEKLGFKDVLTVPEQEHPDPDFSTVASPNPEEHAAFEMARKHAESWGADIIIGTDPDADRMGAAVLNSKGEYVNLTGNQSGAIMLHYLLSQLKEQEKLPANGAVVKTIVTSELGAKVAKSFGLDVYNTLTGFKYIGELMNKFEKTNSNQFLFGYEESYGYLAGTYARDKDAVVAAALICEAGAYYKQQGKSLYDVLQDVYKQHGTHLEELRSLTMKGKAGMEQIRSIMDSWRRSSPASVASLRVVDVLDYTQGIDGLPKENVLKFMLEGGSWFCLRPSGTEPKIKIYFAACGSSRQETESLLQQMEREVMSKIKPD